MTTRSGLTLREVLVVLAIMVILAVVILVNGRRVRVNTRSDHDKMNVRSITQSLVVFTSGNQGDYPRPSRIEPDPSGTVVELGRHKDTTAAIFSMLIWNGNITPEQAVSPRETNPRIRPHTAYQYSNPQAAVKPEDALWDPSFNADFTRTDRGAHLSYATLVITDSRLKMWTDSYSSTEAVVANRAP